MNFRVLGRCYETGLKAVDTLCVRLDRDLVVSLSPLTPILCDFSPKLGKNSQDGVGWARLTYLLLTGVAETLDNRIGIFRGLMIWAKDGQRNCNEAR